MRVRDRVVRGPRRAGPSRPIPSSAAAPRRRRRSCGAPDRSRPRRRRSGGRRRGRTAGRSRRWRPRAVRGPGARARGAAARARGRRETEQPRTEHVADPVDVEHEAVLLEGAEQPVRRRAGEVRRRRDRGERPMAGLDGAQDRDAPIEDADRRVRTRCHRSATLPGIFHIPDSSVQYMELWTRPSRKAGDGQARSRRRSGRSTSSVARTASPICSTSTCTWSTRSRARRRSTGSA